MRSTIPFLVLALAAPAAFGETAAITLQAPASYILVGRTLRIAAFGANPYGTPIDNYVPAWKSNTPSIASVGDDGTISGLTPGMAEIEAGDPDSGVSAKIRVAVYPGRIAISPETLEVLPGSQLKLTATAFDADDNPIPDVAFVWRSALTGIATVDEAGVAGGQQSGRVTISADIPSDDPAYSASIDASLLVRRQPDYKVTRISLPSHTATIRDFSGLSVSKNDNISYIAHLSTGAQVVVMVENGVSKTIAATGQYIPEIDAIAGRFEGTAVNSSGDVLVQVDMHGDYCQRAIVVYQAKGGRRVIGPTYNCDYSVGQRSFNDAGDFVAWHNEQGTGLKATIYRPDGSSQAILSFGDTLPNIGRINNTNYPISMGENGSVYFIAQGDSGNRGAFLWDGKTVKTLVSTGSAAGVTVMDIFDVKEAAAGDFYILVRTPNNGSAVLRYNHGQLTQQATSGSSFAGFTLNWIQTTGDARGSGVLFPAQNNSGNSFLRLGSSTAWFGTYPYWTDLTSTFMTSKGAMVAILAHAQGGKRQLVMVDETGTKVLASAGDTWLGDAPAGTPWEMAIRGTTGDSTVVRGAGEPIHVISAGAVTSMVGPNDSVAGVGPLTAIFAQRAGRSGAMVIEGTRGGGEGIFFAKNGTITKVAERWANERTTDGRQYSFFANWNGSLMAINAKDQIAIYTGLSSGGNGVVVFNTPSSSGKPILMENTTLPGGSRLQNIWGLAMDDTGRVLMWGPSPKGRLLVLWDGQTTRKVIETGETLAGLTYTDTSAAQGVGGAFFVHVSNGFLKYEGGQWTKILTQGDLLSIPPQLSSIVGSEFGVNARGDIAYFGNSGNNDRFLAVRKADGTNTLVAWDLERSPDNEWFTLFNGVSVSDSGVVYFVDSSWNNGQRQIALHRAVPQ